MTAPLASEILAWLIAAFFLIGAAINFFAPASIRADYARWGYPHWFPSFTAGLELTVVALLFLPSGRLVGALLGTLVMLAATGTTLTHREYPRAIAPSVALLLTATLAWASLPDFDR